MRIMILVVGLRLSPSKTIGSSIQKTVAAYSAIIQPITKGGLRANKLAPIILPIKAIKELVDKRQNAETIAVSYSLLGWSCFPVFCELLGLGDWHNHHGKISFSV